MSTVTLLITLILVVSLVSLPSALSNTFNLPTVRVARALQETTYGSWYPAGAQEQTLSISQGDGSSGTQVGWLLTNQIDAEDWPLTATQSGGGSGNVNCPGNTAVLCTAPVADHGYFEIQFNLANVLWGIPMRYGNNLAGVELRQGIAHLFNKAALVANNVACAGTVCIPNDDPLPPCSPSSCPNGGLVDPNPCGWDTLFPETSSTSCVVGSPGGTAFNCAYSTACPTGTVTGTTTSSWQAAIGSPDFCAAAQHFIQAFTDANITGVTKNANCELVAPTGGWPAVVTAITTGGSTCGGSNPPTANVCMWSRGDDPRSSLIRGLAQDICALFSPAWGAWATLAGQPFDCNNSDTGTSNAACPTSTGSPGPCSFVQDVPSSAIREFCGFITNTDGTPNNCWGIFAGGFFQAFPFDSTTYFVYNSLFATKTDYTCNDSNCTSKTPGSTCASMTYTSSAADYMYLCSPNYDSLSSQMENAACLTAAGDPALGQTTPTFANCPGTSTFSSVSAGYQAVDFSGKNAFTIPISTTNDYFARLTNWAQGGSAPGFSTAVGFGFYGLPNYFNWLNAYSTSPALAGTFRQSFLQSSCFLSPFQLECLQDGFLVGNIYDSLFKPNPLCSISTIPGITTCSQAYQLIDWMTTSHRYLCYPGGPPCSASTLGYGNATYFADTTADIRLTLNRANHWHDGGPVTAWDVKYSFVNLNATGAPQTTSYRGTPLLTISRLNIIDEFTLDVSLKATSPFAEYLLGSLTIIPGHVWSACGATTWNNGVAGTNIMGTSATSAAEDMCVGHFGAPSIITINGNRADSPTFDPVANNFLIGSGPYTCQSIGGTGHPAVGTIGGGCSVDGTQFPPFGLNDFTLTRTGCSLTSSGTVCGVAGSGSDYFRSSGALAGYIWTGDIGSGSADFSKVLTVNSCHSATPSANCPHWAQGIGNPSATSTSNLVGVAQRTRVNSFKGISWIGFSTPQSAGTLLTLSCAAGYTLPGTTITPCNASNAGWTATVLPGIGVYASTLYEVGSQITPPGGTSPVSTSTLAPSSAIGCATDYPAGGYDC